MALSLNVNSEFLTIEGEMGEHARILLDGKKATLGDPVHKVQLLNLQLLLMEEMHV